MPRRLWLLLFALLGPGAVALLLTTCAGQLPGARVCSGQQRCPKGSTCVLGRCRNSSRSPVSAKADRAVFPPLQWAKLSASETIDSRGAHESIELGSPAEGASVLLLRFGLQLPSGQRLQRAVLVLDPMRDCARMPGRVRLELSQVLSPWRLGEISWSRRPELSIPMSAGAVQATPAQPLRLDVTELVREWAEHRERYHGLALLADGEGPGSACFTTGLSWGEGPRLETYLAPKPKPKLDGGTDGGDAGDAGAAAGAGGGGGGSAGAGGAAE